MGSWRWTSGQQECFLGSFWLWCPCHLVFQKVTYTNGRSSAPLGSTTTKIGPGWFNITSMPEDPTFLCLKQTNWSQNSQNSELSILSRQCHNFPTSTPRR